MSRALDQPGRRTGDVTFDREPLSSDFAAAMLLERIVRDSYPDRGSREIQPLQWSIIRYVSQTPEYRCTMSWIARFLGLTHAPVVRAINSLVAKGLMAQSPNPEDARSNILKLTEVGRAAATKDPLFAIVERIRLLPEEDRVHFRRALRMVAMNKLPEADDS